MLRGVDWEPDFAQAYRQNYGASFACSDLTRVATWPACSGGGANVWLVSTPCQPFSRAGAELAWEDERSLLTLSLPVMAMVLRPGSVLVEQVDSFLRIGQGLVYRQWVTLCAAAHYVVVCTVVLAQLCVPM